MNVTWYVRTYVWLNEHSLNYLVPRSVQVCIRENMKAWGYCVNNDRFSLWPIGYTKHACLCTKISDDQVKSVVVVGLLAYLFRILQRSHLAL